MAGGDTDVGSRYSPPVGAIYIYNLIVGVGCLTLPHAFQKAGLILGVVFLVVMGFLSYVTVTWVVETWAAANAVRGRHKHRKDEIGTDEEKNLLSVQEGDDDIRLVSDNSVSNYGKLDMPETDKYFHLEERIEVGMMAEIFLGWIGQKIFYIILCLYLYGDLAIYAVYVPRSVTAVTGGIVLCDISISEHDIYYIYLAVFVLGTLPFCFFDFQKTKYMQFFTMFCRNAAFIAMVVIALIAIGKGDGPSIDKLEWGDFMNFPTLFGATVYAFMCHHSVPGLLAPVHPKKKISLLFLVDFVAIMIAYIILAYSAVFAYGAEEIPSAYTTFFKEQDKTNKVVAIILALYPVFTLTSNYPLICITLRNNITRFFPTSDSNAFFRFLRRHQRIIATLLTVVPPTGIAFATRDVSILVSVTGSYPGLGIMFFIPIVLVYFARRHVRELFGSDVINQFRSPFHHWLWLVLVSIISVGFLGFTIFNQIYDAV